MRRSLIKEWCAEKLALLPGTVTASPLEKWPANFMAEFTQRLERNAFGEKPQQS